MSRKTGFTYMELLVVIPLIAILSMVALTTYLNQIKKGHDSRAKQDIAKIKLALEDYYMNNNCYPEVIPKGTGPACNVSWSDYLDEVPCQPDGKTPFYYASKTAPCSQQYCFFVNLENTSDPDIEKSGCGAGCGPGGSYNFGDCSPNINPAGY